MTTDGPERAQEPVDGRDEPTLTATDTATTDHHLGRSRRSDLPAGDSVTLRLARRLGLR